MVYGACAAQDLNMASVRPYVIYVSVVDFAALRRDVAILCPIPPPTRDEPKREEICFCISAVEGAGTWLEAEVEALLEEPAAGA